MNLSEFDDRFLASLVLDSLDYDAQLLAIRSLLRRHWQADEVLTKEIQEIEAFARQASGSANEQAVDEWVDHLHHSVYQDAAHSMAAVGMLAPFIESLFKQAFLGIRELFERNSHAQKAHPRWAMPPDDQWDCRWASPSRPHLVDGIMELADASDLAVHLPAELQTTLAALFEYRNKMFHLGFEWPPPERAKFARRIAAARWPPGWFNTSTSDGEPWIFYLSDAFVDHCLTIVEDVLAGLGAFVRKND